MMTAVWMRARGELRSRLPATLALAVIVGVLGGVVIAAAAGARRTDSAYPRFVKAENALDVVADVDVGYKGDPKVADRILTRIEQLPQVAESGRMYLIESGLAVPDRKRPGNVFPFVSPDGSFGGEINKVKILDGRMYDPQNPDEIVPTFTVANDLGLHVGETVKLVCCGVFNEPPRPGYRPPPLELHVVGIGAAPGMFQPLAGGYLPGVFLSPAFYRAHHNWVGETDQTTGLVLKRGLADVRPFVEEVKALRQALPKNVALQLPFNQAAQTVGVQQATHTQAMALSVLAVLVAIAGIAIFAQALARQTFLESIEYPTLRSVGMSVNQLFGVGMIRAGAIGLAGGIIAVAVGFLLSPLTPTGTARVAEPNPGFAFDATVFILGALGTALVVALLGAYPASRAARARGSMQGTAEAPGTRRPSMVAGFMARSAFPPSASAGVRMALEPGRGRTSVPVRTTIFGASLGLLALAAALAFGASLDRLVADPKLSGWSWDVMMFAGGGQHGILGLDKVLDESPEVKAYSAGAVMDLTIGHTHVITLAMDPKKGSLTPVLIEGHLPRSADEIALGTETMSKSGVHIGGTVPVRKRGGEIRMHVVGRVAIPSLFFEFARPGQGAALTVPGVKRISPGVFNDGHAVFLRMAPATNQQAFIKDLRSRHLHIFILPRTQSGQIANLNGIGNVPLMLAGIVALMAAATLAHTLITSIRRRRFDLAILKTLGFLRRQVSATVAWQATALALIAVVIGLPLGIIAARWGWNVFADHLGVVPIVVIPFAAILLAIPVTILVANLLALVPGRIASRLKAAHVMRTE